MTNERGRVTPPEAVTATEVVEDKYEKTPYLVLTAYVKEERDLDGKVVLVVDKSVDSDIDSIEIPPDKLVDEDGAQIHFGVDVEILFFKYKENPNNPPRIVFRVINTEPILRSEDPLRTPFEDEDPWQ